jgi:hypothetical protein
MKGTKQWTRLIVSFPCLLLMVGFLTTTSLCMADDHKQSVKRPDNHGAQWGKGGPGGFLGKGRDDGDEMTGQVVAWSLGVANLTVALSILIRWMREFVSLAPETKTRLASFNSTQKKFLMKFHYILNPIILLLAVVHWSMSRCKSTTLPEWGLVIMGVIAVLGVVLKFKLCPGSFLRNIYRIHTQPLLLLLAVSLLIIGHISMD